MAAYDVEFASSAAKEFRSLSPELKQRVAAAVDGLSEGPRPPGVRKLAGHRRLYRVRVGPYRIVYEIDDHAQIIHLTRIRHRREAYR